VSCKSWDTCGARRAGRSGGRRGIYGRDRTTRVMPARPSLLAARGRETVPPPWSSFAASTNRHRVRFVAARGISRRRRWSCRWTGRWNCEVRAGELVAAQVAVERPARYRRRGAPGTRGSSARLRRWRRATITSAARRAGAASLRQLTPLRTNDGNGPPSVSFAQGRVTGSLNGGIRARVRGWDNFAKPRPKSRFGSASPYPRVNSFELRLAQRTGTVYRLP